MKTKIKTLILLIAILISVPALSQGPWFTGGNTLSGTFNYLGSVGGNNVPVLFGTNGFNRMIINDGTSGTNDGRIAIGNNLPNNFAPQSRVHIHQTGGGGLNNTFIRFTTNVTNTTSTDGFAKTQNIIIA